MKCDVTFDWFPGQNASVHTRAQSQIGLLEVLWVVYFLFFDIYIERKKPVPNYKLVILVRKLRVSALIILYILMKR